MTSPITGFEIHNLSESRCLIAFVDEQQATDEEAITLVRKKLLPIGRNNIKSIPMLNDTK